MSSIKLSPNASGTGEFTIAAPNSNSNYTLTLPTTAGTLFTNPNGAVDINAGAPASSLTISATGVVGGNGGSLTSLNASNLSTGTVATARLATGTADSTTYLRGDQTWATVSTTPTTAQVLTATAGATANAVGTYRTKSFASGSQSLAYTLNSTYSGSSLGFSTGTWRNMGGDYSAVGSDVLHVYLFLRIS